MMKCSDARPLLDLLCDGALNTKDCALVLAHLQSCEECQAASNELENMRLRFQNAKAQLEMTPDLMDRITGALKEDEKTEKQRLYKRYVKTVPILGIAAVFGLVGLVCIPGFHEMWSRSIAIHSASADVLVEDLAANGKLEPVTDRNEFAKKLGYELKYLQLPAWTLDKAGVYNSVATIPIARFDFVSKDSSDQHFSCYQAQQGVIEANAVEAKSVGAKQVRFGKHGKLQFALWSQNGRDYLFVTELPMDRLEEIVRGV